jgi:hypothetical protein
MLRGSGRVLQGGPPALYGKDRAADRRVVMRRIILRSL